MAAASEFFSVEALVAFSLDKLGYYLISISTERVDSYR